MYLVKYIEQMGTGTLDMIDRCGSAGLPEPEFEAAGEFITRIRRPALAGQPVVFAGGDGQRQRESEPESQPEWGGPGMEVAQTSKNTREKTGKPREKPREKTGKTREKILALIVADSSITTAELAHQLGITAKGVEWQIGKLKQMGVLERIGPAKGGHWKLVEMADE